MPNLLIHATESPPPIRENAPFAVASAMASAIAFEPPVKLSNSNTPAGPFQRIVLASLIASLKSSRVLGPASIPSSSSGILFASQTCVFASLEKSSAAIQSTPRTRFTPFSFAFFIMSRARSSLSFSQRDFPIFPPCAFAKVYVIPPHRIRLSTLPSRFSIIPILVETLEPPMIAVNGRLMLLRTLSTAVTSFSIR